MSLSFGEEVGGEKGGKAIRKGMGERRAKCFDQAPNCFPVPVLTDSLPTPVPSEGSFKVFLSQNCSFRPGGNCRLCAFLHHATHTEYCSRVFKLNPDRVPMNIIEKNDGGKGLGSYK